MSVQQLQSYQAHSQSIKSLRLGYKTGVKVVSGGEDRRVHVWALGNSTPLTTLIGHPHPVTSVAFDYSEEIVAAGSVSGVIKLWDLEQSKVIRTLTGHKDSTNFIEFHPFGEFFASSSLDGSLKVWDIRKKTYIQSFPNCTGKGCCIKISPDGKLVSTSSEEYGFRIFDMTKTNENLIFNSTIPSCCVDFHPQELAVYSFRPGSGVFGVDLESLNSFDSLALPRDNALSLKFMNSPEDSARTSIALATISGIYCIKGENYDQVTCFVPYPLSTVIDFAYISGDGRITLTYADGNILNSAFISVNSDPNSSLLEERNYIDNINSGADISKQLKVLGLNDSDTLKLERPDKTLFGSDSLMKDSHHNFVKPNTAPNTRSHAPPKSRNYIPSSGNHLVGLEPEIYNSLNNSNNADEKNFTSNSLLQVKLLPLTFCSDNELQMIENLKSRHFTLLSTLSLRLANLRHMKSQCTSLDKDSLSNILESLKSLHDPSTAIDILNTIGTKPGLWNLELFKDALPILRDLLLNSHFEDHLNVSLQTLKFMLKSFGPVIKDTLISFEAGFSKSIDLNRDERVEKCLICNILVNEIKEIVDGMKRGLPSQRAIILEIDRLLLENNLPKTSLFRG